MSQTAQPEPMAQGLYALFVSSPEAIISADRDLRVTAWNPAAERIFGFSSGEAVGQHVSLIAPPGEERGQLDALSRVLAGGGVETVETIRRTKSGMLVPVTLTLMPIENGSGTVTGVAAVAREDSDRQRADRALRRLGAIVESSDDAIVSKDLDGIVTSWNRSAERIFGYTAPEMIGRSIRAIIPADRQDEEDQVLARIRRGEKVDHFETIRRRKDGSLVDISLTVSPIRDASGAIV